MYVCFFWGCETCGTVPSLSVTNNLLFLFCLFFTRFRKYNMGKGQLLCSNLVDTKSTQSLRYLFALSLSLSLSFCVLRVVNFRSSPGGRGGGGKNNNTNGSSSSRAQIEPLGNGRREICPAILSHRGEVTNGTNLSRGGRRRRRVTREK